MKLELNRKEMEQAIKCFISAQGIDIRNQEMKCVFSRETVSVELTANDIDASNECNTIVEVEDTLKQMIEEETTKPLFS